MAQTRLGLYLVKAGKGDSSALMAIIDTPFALLAAVHFAHEKGGEDFEKQYGTLAREEIARLLEKV